MIIVISITSISSLLFVEPDIIKAIRIYRLLFMFGALLMGIVGVVLVFIYFVVKMANLESFGKPYLIPYAPTEVAGLKNSIVKFPTKDLDKRERYLSNNTVKYRERGK